MTDQLVTRSRVGHDSAQSTATRRDLIRHFADTLVLGTHFAPPTAGVLRSNGMGAARLDHDG